ncbi:hypothetical protein SSS_00193 [Sarcoptes scabiei]|nr:hypothetical protein SSS_00193 [Sarcoptes scabiei]
MVKRAEDRQKFKEFERIKIQNEQLVENKKQMAEKIADLSRKNSSLEKAAQEAKDEQIRQADEIKDLIDNAEMAVIDKEMAENKAEQLQIQLEQCREQLEEAKLDFEILKTEIEDKGVDGAANSFELKKLEEQNARYKEALLKLRDISAADRNNLKILQKDVETKNDEITNLIQSSDKTKSELNDCYEQIKDLKEQVDMALGSQEMVEKLTEKNLTMEDKIEELQKALDEEEKIKELSNMIIEEKDEIIADLRDEVDRFKTNLFNLRNTFIASQEAVQDHETTIKKFRELVTMLKDENSMLRTAKEQDSTKVQQAVDAQKQLENIEFKTRLLDRKDLTRTIDMELKQLDIEQCYRHMIYLSRFFPDSFFNRGGDHDSIAILLYVPRMFTKCCILERQIMEKYSTESNRSITSDSIVADCFGDGKNIQIEALDKLKQQVFINYIVYLLTSIRSTLDKYRDTLTKCDCDLFLKLGSLYPELSSHEKNIDYFIDLLREDKLDENVSLDSMEKILSYLQSLYNIHIGSTSFENNENHNKFLNDFLEVLRTGTETSLLDLKILTKMINSEATLFVSTMVTTLNDIEQFGKKIRRRMVSAGSGSSDQNPACLIRFPFIIKAEMLDSLSNFSSAIRNVKTIRETVMNDYIADKFVKNIPNNSNEEEKIVNVLTLDELDLKFKEWTGNDLKSINEILTNVMNCICKFSTVIQQGDYDVPKTDSQSISTTNDSISTNYNLPPSLQCLFSRNMNRILNSLKSLDCAPLDQRAGNWRAQSEHINEYRTKIQTQESDIAELKRLMKIKIDEMSEMQIRRDLSDKKLKEITKEKQKIQNDFESLSKEFKEKEAERERTLKKYNQEINDLYNDNRLMKEKLKNFSRNASLGKVLMPGTPNSSISVTGSAASPISIGDYSFNQQQSPSLSFNNSLNQTSMNDIGHRTSTIQTASMSMNGDSNELHQRILELRSAMKHLAAKNSQLKTFLAYEQICKKNIEPETKHFDSESKFSNAFDANVEKQFQEFRTQLIRLKNEYQQYRCSEKMSILSDLNQSSIDQKKTGWSRCISDVIKRKSNQQKLYELGFRIRFRQLCNQFELFVKNLNKGFSCDSTLVSFIAPNISKIASAEPKLIARIKVNGDFTCTKSNTMEIDLRPKTIPIEVTNADLNRIQSMLLI